MLKGKIIVVRRHKSEKGGNYHVYKIGMTDTVDVNKVEKYVCSLLYERSTQTFTFIDDKSKITDYTMFRILNILGSKDFRDCLMKFKYDNRVTYSSFLLTGSMNIMMEDISKQWSEY